MRRWPSKKLHGERVRAVVSPIGGGQLVSRAPTAVGDQMILDEGQEPQLFPAAMATRAGRYELFSLWWPTRSLRSRSTRP